MLPEDNLTLENSPMASMNLDNPYLLLTPGPLSTTPTVRQAMLRDWCTWDTDYNDIVQKIRAGLLRIGNASDKYTSVLMQGSGSFSVEAVLWTGLTPESHLLIVSNGAYGQRMAKMAAMMGAKSTLLSFAETTRPTVEAVEAAISANNAITHVGMVHCETTTGILNDYLSIARLAKAMGKWVILDAMSSFGGIPIDLSDGNVDFLISSANKCIQGVPGFGFVLAKREILESCKGNSKSHSLDLYDQWHSMETQSGKWRFTSPTHTVRAFLQAMIELEAEGGVEVRNRRYRQNHEVLVGGMEKIGFSAFLPPDLQSPIITAFLEPDSASFSFKQLYDGLKKEGFVIYPGKVSQAPTFRIGHIGNVFPKDIERLCQAVEKIKFW
jgi:2-aminoethylphosphonate-pyruvate transaminase